MALLTFIFLSYLAAGIVYIVHEAESQLTEADTIRKGPQHPPLRTTAGMIMLLLWPAFLINEMTDQHRSPMAVRIG